MRKNIERKIIQWLLVCLGACPTVLYAQAIEAPIPFDKEVRTGKLSNGFTYFIRKNSVPEKRVVMYLVNKVGSILETDGQQGLAHFMEHMSFNGTKHFPKNELIEYLQKSGVRFGADLNASTGFDQTIYQLPLPSDDAKLLANGIQILRDWAQDATLDQTEIDKERGVVLEERRLHLGLQERISKQLFPIITNQSKYASRMPIGTEAVLKSFTRDTLQAFYKDWYRPDLQALIVVGDIDVASMEKTIQSMFADLKIPSQAKNRKQYPVPLTGKSQYSAITDKEIPSSGIQFYYKRKASALKTKSDYRQAMLANLFNQLIAGKLREKGQTQQLPYLSASISVSELIGDLEALSINVNIKNNNYEQGIKSVWQTVEGVKRNGFTRSDIERAKSNYLSFMQSQVHEKDKRSSEEYVREYVNYFTKEESSPGIATEYELTREILETLTSGELKAFAAACLSVNDRDIIITAPESEKGHLPSLDIINSWLLAVQQTEITEEKDDFVGKPLLTKLPTPGKVVSMKADKKIETTEVVLSNGVKVILKPTTWKNDEILFQAFSPGGTSLYPDAEFETASSASSLIASSGVAEFSSVTLQKMLTGKQVWVSPFIGERAEGINGSSTIQDIETALQLVHLYFTSPRADTVVFNNTIERSKNALINRYANPAAVFSDTMMLVLGNHSFRRMPPSAEKIDRIKLNQALRIYKERFSNAGDFCFTFVGSFTPETLIPLLEKNIGSLPSSKEKEQAKDLGIAIPAGKITKLVNQGTEDKATVRLVISGNYQYSEHSNVQLKALKAILGYKLIERLREIEGNTYSPSVSLNYAKLPRNTYSFTISFGCSPANVDKLIAATSQEIKSLKTTDLPQDYIVKFASEQKGILARQTQENSFWLNYLVEQYVNSEGTTTILEYTQTIQEVTTKSVQKAALIYLNESNFIQFALLPGANE
jgi:zinc protease